MGLNTAKGRQAQSVPPPDKRSSNSSSSLHNTKLALLVRDSIGPSHAASSPLRKQSSTQITYLNRYREEVLRVQRHESQQKLSRHWNHIANKYGSIPPEEDDEIDLFNCNISYDRGKLRASVMREFGETVQGEEGFNYAEPQNLPVLGPEHVVFEGDEDELGDWDDLSGLDPQFAIEDPVPQDFNFEEFDRANARMMAATSTDPATWETESESDSAVVAESTVDICNLSAMQLADDPLAADDEEARSARRMRLVKSGGVASRRPSATVERDQPTSSSAVRSSKLHSTPGPRKADTSPRSSGCSVRFKPTADIAGSAMRRSLCNARPSRKYKERMVNKSHKEASSPMESSPERPLSRFVARSPSPSESLPSQGGGSSKPQCASCLLVGLTANADKCDSLSNNIPCPNLAPSPSKSWGITMADWASSSPESSSPASSPPPGSSPLAAAKTNATALLTPALTVLSVRAKPSSDNTAPSSPLGPKSAACPRLPPVDPGVGPGAHPTPPPSSSNAPGSWISSTNGTLRTPLVKNTTHGRKAAVTTGQLPSPGSTTVFTSPPPSSPPDPPQSARRKAPVPIVPTPGRPSLADDVSNPSFTLAAPPPGPAERIPTAAELMPSPPVPPRASASVSSSSTETPKAMPSSAAPQLRTVKTTPGNRRTKSDAHESKFWYHSVDSVESILIKVEPSQTLDYRYRAHASRSSSPVVFKKFVDPYRSPTSASAKRLAAASPAPAAPDTAALVQTTPRKRRPTTYADESSSGYASDNLVESLNCTTLTSSPTRRKDATPSKQRATSARAVQTTPRKRRVRMIAEESRTRPDAGNDAGRIAVKHIEDPPRRGSLVRTSTATYKAFPGSIPLSSARDTTSARLGPSSSPVKITPFPNPSWTPSRSRSYGAVCGSGMQKSPCIRQTMAPVTENKADGADDDQIMIVNQDAVCELLLRRARSMSVKPPVKTEKAKTPKRGPGRPPAARPSATPTPRGQRPSAPPQSRAGQTLRPRVASPPSKNGDLEDSLDLEDADDSLAEDSEDTGIPLVDSEDDDKEELWGMDDEVREDAEVGEDARLDSAATHIQHLAPGWRAKAGTGLAV